MPLLVSVSSCRFAPAGLLSIIVYAGTRVLKYFPMSREEDMGRKNRAYYSLFTIRRAVPHAVTGCYLMLLSAVIFALQILKNQLNQINPERENKKSAVFFSNNSMRGGRNRQTPGIPCHDLYRPLSAPHHCTIEVKCIQGGKVIYSANKNLNSQSTKRKADWDE